MLCFKKKTVYRQEPIFLKPLSVSASTLPWLQKAPYFPIELIIVRLHLKIGLGMLAHRAKLRRLLSDHDMAAV